MTNEGTVGVKDVCEAIWAAERELELLDWQVRGVRVWQALRFETSQRLSRSAGVFQDSEQGTARGAGNRARLALKMLPGTALHNPFAGAATFDALVFESARTALVDGRNVCIYTDDLVRELTAEGTRLQLLELADSRAPHTKDADPRRAYLDFIELAGAVRGLAPRPLSPSDADRVRAAVQFFEARLGVSVPLARRVAAYVEEFRTQRFLYRRLLAKRRPKRVYCVCSYGRLAPMLKAAHDEGVESIELQHGTVSHYHMGYSFPVRPRSCELEYQPDVFYSWGELWNQLMDLPLDPQRVVAHGFRHFERIRARYAGVARTPGSVLVLSQPVIGPQLADRLLEQIDAFEGRQIVYKLHPREYSAYQQYPSLVRLSQRPNVSVVTGVDLYELMARAEIQIGVFSTAIYEGLQFGCKTVLVDLPGIEHMAKLIEIGKTEPFDAFVARLRASGARAPAATNGSS